MAELNTEWAAVAERQRLYPEDPERMQSTKLGNVIVAVEDRAGGRYGLVSVQALARLRPLLPPTTATGLVASEDDLGFAVRMSSASLLTSLVSSFMLVLPLVANRSLAGAASLIIPATFLVMAWSSYSSAVRVAIQYGETLAVIFDLHRFLLYGALRQPVPRDTAEEREINAMLSRAMENGRYPGPFIFPSSAQQRGQDS